MTMNLDCYDLEYRGIIARRHTERGSSTLLSALFQPEKMKNNLNLLEDKLIFLRELYCPNRGFDLIGFRGAIKHSGKEKYCSGLRTSAV